jgi:hypothetical protein
MGRGSRRGKRRLCRVRLCGIAEQCQTHVGRSFRAMLARADLCERPDAKPGPPRREPAQATDGPSGRYGPTNARTIARWSKLGIIVRSGSLIVGLLSRLTHGPARWLWILTGVRRPDEDFVWHGDAGTDRDTFDAIAASWARWTWWAGLEPIALIKIAGCSSTSRP